MRRLFFCFGVFSCILPVFSQASSAAFQRLVALNKHDEVAASFRKGQPMVPVGNVTELRVRSVEMLKVLYGGIRQQVLFDQSRDGLNLLLISAQNGQVDCVQFLLDNGARINYKDVYGRTALYYSAGNTDDKCAKVLIKAGAYIDCQNSDGTTPLMFAIGEGNVGVVRALLSAGANVALRDGAGKSALAHAMAEPKVHYVSAEAIGEIRLLLKEEVNRTSQPKHSEDQRAKEE